MQVDPNFDKLQSAFKTILEDIRTTWRTIHKDCRFSFTVVANLTPNGQCLKTKLSVEWRGKERPAETYHQISRSRQMEQKLSLHWKLWPSRQMTENFMRDT